MFWPVPLGVRVNALYKMNFLAQLAHVGHRAGYIAGFPEYEHKLSKAQLLQLRAIAEQIVFSQKSGTPIAAVSVIGHADRAMRLQNNPAEQKKKEMEVSLKRAEVGKQELITMLKSFPEGAEIAAKIEANTEVTAKGATELLVQWPRNELEMSRNRRVEFRWAMTENRPTIHPSIEFPPRPPPSEEDDPNIVFAGQRFKSKIVEGASISAGGGYITLTMVIWDVDNHRLAGYDYHAGYYSAGINPIPFINESEWSDFTTPVPIQVDQFSGEASHRNTVALLGKFTLLSMVPETKPKVPPWPATGLVIGEWSGFSAAIALEGGILGSLSIINNSVRVYRGGS